MGESLEFLYFSFEFIYGRTLKKHHIEQFIIFLKPYNIPSIGMINISHPKKYFKKT